MPTSDRVSRLRRQSLDAVPTLSAERARLMTEFYRQETGLVSTPVRRALAFRYLMEHKTICINDGELIVGEKGPAPPRPRPPSRSSAATASPISTSSTAAQKIPFAVSAETRQTYAEQIIPFWQGKSMRELIFQEMTESGRRPTRRASSPSSWSSARPATPCWTTKSTAKGCSTSWPTSTRSLAKLDYLRDPAAYAKQEELKAMRICALALIRFAERHAERADELAADETDPARRMELRRIAEVCRHVPAHAPRDFWEALQYYWFVHLGVTTELNTWDAFDPGRLDQHLYPFYQQRAGRRHADARPGRRAAAMLLDQVQQPARAAQGGRDRRRERHLHRLRPDQHRRAARGRLGRRQRGDLPAAGRGRGDAPAAAQRLAPGQQEEPRPLHQARRQDHPHRLRAAVDLQRRPDRAGAGAPGQVDRRCAQRRVERLRGGRRFRQGELQPDRLLQHAQGAGARAAQRRRSAHRACSSARRPAIRRPSAPSTSCSPPTRRSCGISSTSRCAATTSSSGSTPHYLPAPFLSLLTDDCIAHGQGLPRRRRALQHLLHPGRGPGHPDRLPVGAQSSRLRAGDDRHGRAAGRAGRRLRRGRTPAPDAAEPHPALRQRRRLPPTI